MLRALGRFVISPGILPRATFTRFLEGQYIGLEEVGDEIWDVYYSTVRSRQMDERFSGWRMPLE